MLSLEDGTNKLGDVKPNKCIIQMRISFHPQIPGPVEMTYFSIFDGGI